MKVAHFDCFSGISGDMTLAALISAGVDDAAIRAGLDSLGLPLKLKVEPTQRGSFAALSVHVEAEDDQPHRYLRDIEAILDRGRLTAGQKSLAQRIFRRLAEAEGKVHGTSPEEVHFHEVGALDSIADIVGSAIGLELLGVDHFTARSVPTGQGTVKAAHGLMPIPAPATAELLKGIPLAFSSIKSELTTPTGAAILATVVSEWTDSPLMVIEHIGYGAGQKDFPQQANLLRLFVGSTVPQMETDGLWVVETNLDHLSAEVIGYAQERITKAGAVDVFTQPIQMKKQRPGVLLSALVPMDALAAVEQVIFEETGTLGLRRHFVQRHTMQRQSVTVDTRFGSVAGKLSWLEGGLRQFSPEYEDCARIARETGLPLRSILEEVKKAYEQGSR